MANLRQRRASKRRQRRVRAAANDLTEGQWKLILATWEACAYCGKSDDLGKLQKDCVLPISRGGRYTLTNVVPACASCNASKCNFEVTSWMRRKRLGETDFMAHWTASLAQLRDSSAAEVDEAQMETE